MAELDGDFEGHTVPGRVFDSNGNISFYSSLYGTDPDRAIIFVSFSVSVRPKSGDA